MKVVGISASRRQWGNCDCSVKTLLLGCREAGAEIEFYRLTDFKILQCKGCFDCVKEGRCSLEDDLYRLLEIVASCDCLVIASPVYFLLPPSGVIALLDRLLVAPRYFSGEREKPSVTITLMGNRRWRGLCEPILNFVVSLMGFEVTASFGFVAEGPGSILLNRHAVQRLTLAGNALAKGGSIKGASGESKCPVCRSDFFRIEENEIRCPICGKCKAEKQLSRKLGSKEESLTWGLKWLESHIDGWISPSIERYATRRRKILTKVRELKEKYEDRR